MDVGYINPEVAKMYGIPYHKLTVEQKRILHEDSKRRKKLIKERQEAVMQCNLKAFKDEAKMERALVSCYQECQKQILADVAEALAKVEKDGGTWSYANKSALTRSRGLFEQIGAELQKLGVKEQGVFQKGLESIYTDQFKRTLYTLGKTITVRSDFTKLNPELVRKTVDYPWSGAMFSDRLWNDKAALGRNLRLGLAQSMALGEGVPKITERINKNIGTSQYNAERIARTETKRVCYVAQDDVFDDCGVEEVRYMCANSILGGGGDKRVCKVCRAFDGMVFRRGDEPKLPMHPNCRCWYLPEISDTFEDGELNDLTMGIRASDGFDEWEDGIDFTAENLSGNSQEGLEISRKGYIMGSESSSPEAEPAPKESSHKGKDRSLEIAKSIIDGPDYGRRMSALGERPKVQKRIVEESREILHHRSGTLFEDLVFIHSVTNDRKKNTNYNRERAVVPTKAMKKMVRKADDYTVISIHNHPGSSVPSPADIVSLIGRKCKYGLVVGHDGSIFKYSVAGEFNELTYKSAVNKVAVREYTQDALHEFIVTALSAGVFVEVL